MWGDPMTQPRVRCQVYLTFVDRKVRVHITKPVDFVSDSGWIHWSASTFSKAETIRKIRDPKYGFLGQVNLAYRKECNRVVICDK
jgi:hypothetical protein